MSEEVELNGRVYKKFAGAWHDENFIRAPGAIARELDLLARKVGVAAMVTVEEAAATPATETKKSSSGGDSQESAFSHEDVSPIIAGIIREQVGESGAYVKHRELVAAMLAHPEAKEQIDSAVEQRGHSPKQWASWMVQSFSAAMTADRSDFEEAFERKRIDDQWAYRPKNG